MFKKPFIDLQSFENEIYQKNNLLIKPLKIKDIKKRYTQSLKNPFPKPNVDDFLFHFDRRDGAILFPFRTIV